MPDARSVESTAARAVTPPGRRSPRSRRLLAGLLAASVAGPAAGCTPGTPGAASGPTASAPASSVPASPGTDGAGADPSLEADPVPGTDADAPASADTSPAPGTDPDAPRPTPAPGTGDPDGGVSVVLTSVSVDAAAGAVVLSGYAAGVLADGATCRYELRRDGVTVDTTVTSVADATVTSCPWGEIPLDRLSAGRWEARLVYPAADVWSQWHAVTVP